jgi:hypothetical protein
MAFNAREAIDEATQGLFAVNMNMGVPVGVMIVTRVGVEPAGIVIVGRVRPGMSSGGVR